MAPAESPDPFSWLCSDSEIARRLCAPDSAPATLGPVQCWPELLRSSLSLCLASPLPILLWWGPRHVCLYNDAFRALLGARHPSVLGHPCAEAWPDLWALVGPSVSAVMLRGETVQLRDLSLPVARRSTPENARVTFSLSPIRTVHGDIVGVFCPTIETTQDATRREQMVAAADRANLQAMNLLNDVANRCAKTGESEQECLDEVVKVAIALSGAEKGSLQRLDRPTNTLRLVAHRGFDSRFVDYFQTVAIAGASACAAAIASNQRVFVEDVTHSSLLANSPALPMLLEGGVRAMHCTPLADGTGAVLGVISVHFCEPHRPSEREMRLLGLLARHAADFLARQQVNRAIQESEERFRALVSATSDAVYRMSSDWSEMRHLRGRGFIPDTLEPSRTWLGRYIHPADQAYVMRNVQRAITTRSVFELEHRVIRVDGSPGWTYSRAIPIFDQQGEIVEWFGAASDVTLRKEAEQAMQLSESRYRTLFDSIDEGYCIVRVLFDDKGKPCDYRFEEVNQSFARQTGIHNAVGRCMCEIVPEHESFWFETYGRIAATGQPERFTHIATGLDRWYDVYAFRMGKPEDRRVAVLFNDVTERKQVEEALRVSEKRLRTVIEQLPAGVGVTDKTGRWTLCNSMMERYFAHSIPSTQPERAARWSGWDERGNPVPPHNWPGKRALRGETVLPGLEMRYIDGDGRAYWMRVSAAPLRDDNSIVIGACVAIQDVSEVKNAEHALREADRRKDEFLATLAHELRNPLAPICNGLHILRAMASDGNGVGDTSAVYEMLERQVSHMVRLVDDLLEVSRISGGKIELRSEPADLADLLRSAMETSRPLIEAADHAFLTSLPSEALILDADPVRVTQIIANLLNNAAKYTDAGGQIWLTAHRDGTDAVIVVRDNGIGIPDTMLAKVFDLFTQLEHGRHRAQGGLGIGLTLVRRLVEMHGGQVEARSDGPGKGSEFIVRLPLAQGQRPTAVVPTSNQPSRGTTAHRILVVDDNEDAANTLSFILQGLGNQVRVARDGPEGLAALESECPDVVLLDIGMPGMDGYELARRARLKAQGDLTLIALTGWGQEEDRRRSKEAGIDHHLVKPVDVEALGRLLASVEARRY
ncbi:PAS domain-containing protein [Tahibacter amnicola]|uniref:histidine kinase n=1 Tax=Tahibacter amnicola TaxID=2976241 RepID=A0ABY6B8F3_9GAMM|nr:PAS domain-containing protein [Tahibacter amnicola]UXI65842.1 PAS domain-containing protein [Tahibacter amnicola]